MPKPNLSLLGEAVEETTEAAKPKKLFRPPGGGGGMFAQIMKQEMSKTNEKSAKLADKDAY